MAIEGIDRIVYGVDDLSQCHDFIRDWGLDLVEKSPAGEIWATLNGSEVVLRHRDDPTLPPSIEDIPTIRQVVWGVETQSDLDFIRSKLEDRPDFRAADNMVSAADPNGLNVGFQLSCKKEVDLAPSSMNFWGRNERIDTPSKIYDRACPVEIGHVVFFTPDHKASSAFYESIGFCLSDQYPGRGRFLRCSANGGHHDLFLLETPEKRCGLNHVAFTVRDIHEVFGGGLHMSRCGWDTQLGPGRHPISSAYFWYFHNPAGALMEYYADEDFLTENWVPREIEPGSTVFAEWAVSGGLDGNTRRQKQGPNQTKKMFLTE